MSTELGEIELFAGRYWFTKWEKAPGTKGMGIVKGPFDTKREAEQAQAQYKQEAIKCQETTTTDSSQNSQSLTPSEHSSQ